MAPHYRHGKHIVPQEKLDLIFKQLHAEVFSSLWSLVNARGIPRYKFAARYGCSRSYICDLSNFNTQEAMNIKLKQLVELFAAAGQEVHFTNRKLGSPARTRKQKQDAKRKRKQRGGKLKLIWR